MQPLNLTIAKLRFTQVHPSPRNAVDEIVPAYDDLQRTSLICMEFRRGKLIFGILRRNAFDEAQIPTDEVIYYVLMEDYYWNILSNTTN